MVENRPEAFSVAAVRGMLEAANLNETEAHTSPEYMTSITQEIVKAQGPPPDNDKIKKLNNTRKDAKKYY